MLNFEDGECVTCTLIMKSLIDMIECHNGEWSLLGSMYDVCAVHECVCMNVCVCVCVCVCVWEHSVNTKYELRQCAVACW